MGAPIQRTRFDPGQGSDILESYAKAQSLKNLIQHGAIQQEQMNELRRSREKELLITQAIQEAGGVEQALPKIMQIDPIYGSRIQEEVRKWNATSFEEKTKRFDLESKKMEALGRLAGTITDPVSYENAVQQALNQELITPDHAAAFRQQGYNPETVKGWQTQAMTMQQQLANARQKLIDEQALRKGKAEATLVEQELNLSPEYREREAIKRTRVPVPGTDVPYPPAVEAQKTKMAEDAAERQAQRDEERFKRQQGALTGSTKTMIEAAPRVNDFVARIRTLVNQQKAQLGPAAGRWNEFMTGRVGAENPEFAKLRTNVGLLKTLLMRMHVGARGGQYIMSHFQSLIDSGKQSPENLLAALGEIENYATDLEQEGAEAGHPVTGGGGSAAGIKIVRDANGRIVGIE